MMYVFLEMINIHPRKVGPTLQRNGKPRKGVSSHVD